MAIENLKQIEESLKLPEGTLAKAIENEESVKVEVPELVIRTKEEHETFISNKNKESQQIGVEIAVKKVRNELGIETEHKTIPSLLEAHGKSVLEKAKIEPNKKIEELESDNRQLRTNFTAKDEEFNQFKSVVEVERTVGKRNDSIKSVIGDNTIITKDKALVLFNSDIESVYEEGKLIHKKNGETMKNAQLEPLSTKDVFNTWATDNSMFKQASGGNGGGDEGGGAKAGTIEDFRSRMKTQNIKEGSTEFNNKMNEEISAGTLKI